MRVLPQTTPRGFEAKAYSGTRAILIALNCPEALCQGLMGFAFEREEIGSSKPAKFLRSQKVFKSIVPDPKHAHDPLDPTKPVRFYTDDFPIQSFLWGDYALKSGTTYRFRILPKYGKPGNLTHQAQDEITFQITTEQEWVPGETVHGVWFNRGAIASQKFAEEFGNKAPDHIEDVHDPEVQWLSRGLLEACLRFINQTANDEALRVAAYEFTYQPILKALKDLIDKGIDVQIIYHDTKQEKRQPNETAMRKAGLPIDDQKVTYRRSKTEIPHNKFIVRLKGDSPVEVWTGSTNFTPSGFLGQTNVGHRVADARTAKQYFQFWNVLKNDPELEEVRSKVATLSPNPPELIPASSIVRFFSPRDKSEMLGWYGRRMLDTADCLCFTAAFGVAKPLIQPIAAKRTAMRFVLLEKPLLVPQKKELTADFNRVILSYGIPLGQLYTIKNGKVAARRRIKEFELDKWFFKEDLYRPQNDGFVFFVHTKFLLVDPLSDDPLVCTGSANFSSNSLLKNDENMLLIRGDTRVADIYLTEFDRIFRHFYFRNIANELAGAETSDDAKSAFLSEDDSWTKNYFKPRTLKHNRRLMFFTPSTSAWVSNAAMRNTAKTPPSKQKTLSRKQSQPQMEKGALTKKSEMKGLARKVQVHTKKRSRRA